MFRRKKLKLKLKILPRRRKILRRVFVDYLSRLRRQNLRHVEMSPDDYHFLLSHYFSEHRREVSIDEISEFCELWNLASSFTSASEDHESVESAFAKIAKEIFGKLGIKKRKPSKSIKESFNKLLGQIVQKP